MNPSPYGYGPPPGAVWSCPFCRAQNTLLRSTRFTTFGVAWLVVTIFFTCGLLAPFAWLFREPQGYCKNCGSRVF